MSKPGSQWWQLLNTGFAAPGEGVGSLELGYKLRWSVDKSVDVHMLTT